jgi:hypothetical protein
VDRALEFLEAADWKHTFTRQITHRFPPADAQQALDTVRCWRAGKAVIKPAATHSG